MKGWKVGSVRVALFDGWTGASLGFKEQRGLVRGSWGIWRDGGEENSYGELLRWNLTHRTTGRNVTNCISPAVASALAADLDQDIEAWSWMTASGVLDVSVAGRISAVLARWGADGQVVLTDRARQWACRHAGLVVVPAVESAA